MIRALGADHVIDYAQEDFIQADQRYHLVFDVVGNRPFRGLQTCTQPRRLLRPHRA